MSDDILNGFNLDFSYTNQMASSIQREMEEHTREMRAVADEAYERRQKMQNALEATAENTSETNTILQEVVKNQSQLIDMQNEQLETLKSQLEIDEKQLNVLRCIFSNNQDSMEIEQELADLLQQQIDSNHPVKAFLLDKAGDLAVAGITTGVPLLYSAFKAFLVSKGLV